MINKPVVHVLILAGGHGTRFWPLSRPETPKQFLPILGPQTLFQATWHRIASGVDSKNVWVAGSEQFASEIFKQTQEWKIPREQILLEPSGKNTASAIAWAAYRIYSKDPQALMVVLPADHLIGNPGKFRRYLKTACNTAQEGYLVTLGIEPTRAETGYGYLKAGTVKIKGGLQAYPVLAFKEKPAVVQAKKFIKSGRYYWNSGMFVWQAKVIIEELQKFLPEISLVFQNEHSARKFRRLWKGLPGISIDYGILEKSSKVMVVPTKGIGWSDLGSWQALQEVLPKDSQGNLVKGPGMVMGCEKTLVYSSKRWVCAVGVKDLIIVETPDAVLICAREESQQVRQAALEHQKFQEHKQ